ncbi:hypothetical protein KAU39_03065 [bacterium]|nr:hypothetical protein [bacterium]
MEKVINLKSSKWWFFLFVFIGIFSYVASCSFLFFKKFNMIQLVGKWFVFLTILYLFCHVNIVFFDLVAKWYGKEPSLNELFAISGFNFLFATLLIPLSLICKYLIPLRFLIYGIILFIFTFWILKLQFLGIKKIYNLKNIEVFLMLTSSLLIEILLLGAGVFLFLLTFVVAIL